MAEIIFCQINDDASLAHSVWTNSQTHLKWLGASVMKRKIVLSSQVTYPLPLICTNSVVVLLVDGLKDKSGNELSYFIANKAHKNILIDASFSHDVNFLDHNYTSFLFTSEITS